MTSARLRQVAGYQCVLPLSTTDQLLAIGFPVLVPLFAGSPGFTTFCGNRAPENKLRYKPDFHGLAG